MKTIRMLTPEQAADLTFKELLRLRRYAGVLAPIAGAEDPEDEHENSDEDELEVEPDENENEDENEDNEEQRESDIRLRADEQVVSKSELERLRRIARENEQKAKQAEREARKQADKEQREAGNWEELLRERDEAISEAAAERDAARLELDATLRSQRVGAAANRLGFRDAQDAEHFLSEDETQDDSSTERALKRLAREKPYLVEARRSTSAPSNGEGALLTMEEIKRMKPEEVNARWQEVQDAMAASGGR